MAIEDLGRGLESFGDSISGAIISKHKTKKERELKLLDLKEKRQYDLDTKIAEEDRKAKQKLLEMSEELDTDISNIGASDLIDQDALDAKIEKFGTQGGIDYKQSIVNKANTGKRLEARMKEMESITLANLKYGTNVDTSALLSGIQEDISSYSNIDKGISNDGTDKYGKPTEEPVAEIATPEEQQKQIEKVDKEVADKQPNTTLSTKGIPYVDEKGKVAYTKSGVQQHVEEDKARQTAGLTALNSAIGADAKATLAADLGLNTMFGQIFSLSSYMNAREEEIREAGLTGNSKIKATKAWFNSLPWIEKEGFERTGAIPGATGFTILRTVPNITGSKQGLSSMAKMITPSFPKGYTEKGYSNQMLIQAVDDSYRFRAAVSKSGMLDKLGYEKNKEGKYIIPENVSREEGVFIRNEMEKMVLSDSEKELLTNMKQIILDAPPAKKFSSKHDTQTGKVLTKRQQQIIQLRKELNGGA